MTFDDFNFHEGISDALYYTGFKTPTPIQAQAIPKIMEGQDVLGTAQTGTGKTAAFMLPVLNKLAENPCQHIDTLVVVPTRELALQIDQEVQGFSYYADASSIAIYGGGDGNEFNEQRKAIINGVNIIVATPGKLISHLNMGYVDLSNLKHFILDEADRMLDMGFVDDLNKIIKHLPEKRQNLMFSATMPPEINKLAAKMLNNYFEIKIAISKPAAGVSQSKYEVYDTQKIPVIIDIIKDRKDYTSILIFTSTKKKVSEVSRALIRNKLPAKAISSDFDQKERESVLLSFRSKETKVLVATDVLSRGIDIKDINLVINYDVPNDAEDYVHRIGRTARAETKGEAITLVNKDDEYKMIRIERLIERKVDKNILDKELGNAPNFKTDKKGGSNSGGKSKGGGYKGKPNNSFRKKNADNKAKGNSKDNKVSSNKPNPRPTGKTSSKPANKPNSRSTSKTSSKPANKPNSRSTSKTSSKPANKPNPRPTGKDSSKPTNKPNPRPTGKASSKPTNKPNPRPANKPSAKTTSKANLSSPKEDVKSDNSTSSDKPKSIFRKFWKKSKSKADN